MNNGTTRKDLMFVGLIVGVFVVLALVFVV